MGAMSPIHWIILIVLVLLVLGGGKLSSIMGDAAKGVKAFKEGLKDEPDSSSKAASDALPRTEKDKG